MAVSTYVRVVARVSSSPIEKLVYLGPEKKTWGYACEAPDKKRGNMRPVHTLTARMQFQNNGKEGKRDHEDGWIRIHTHT